MDRFQEGKNRNKGGNERGSVGELLREAVQFGSLYNERQRTYPTGFSKREKKRERERDPPKR